MNAVRVELTAAGVAVLTFDHPDKAVNTISLALLDELEDKVAPVLDNPAVRAFVLASGKKDTFIAGADLELLEGMTESEAASMSRRGNALLSRLAQSPKPSVAAVHGAALGGGLEVVLACRFILASDDPATVLALPEVMLGLIPGGGGTQRLTRRVGLRQALPLMLTGKRLRPRAALRLGLVDALTSPGGIAATAERAAVALAEGRLSPRRRRRSLVDRLVEGPLRPLVLAAARRQVRRRTHGLYPAPEAVLDCVATGLSRGESAGLAREAQHFGVLVPSPQSRSLVWLYHAATAARKPVPDVEPRAVRRLAVLGAGLMGSGIASVSLNLCQVVLRDVNEQALRRGARAVLDGLGKQVRSRAIRRVDADCRWARLLPTTLLADTAGCDLVVEAVFEELELKRRVLAEAEQLIGPDAVFASNTSALPIAAIASGARHPERVLGMHFFSPVPKMPLLEIVAAAATAPWAVATARAFGARQGKSCIVVKDGPGFYTTRILAPYLNEAMLLMEEGARIEEVDRAMRAFGFPVGPVALVDEVGIDVGAHVARDLAPLFAGRGGRASDLLPRLLADGRTGRKSRRGFYRYPGRGRKRPDSAVYKLMPSRSRRPIPTAEIQQRLALLMVSEAVRCLEEQVVASPADGDLGAVLGLGFPPLHAGPFHWVDAVGAATAVSQLEALAGRLGPRFEPAPLLAEMARSGKRFYP